MLLCEIHVININWIFTLIFLLDKQNDEFLKICLFYFLDASKSYLLHVYMIIFSLSVTAEFILPNERICPNGLQQPSWVDENQEMRTVVLALPSWFISLNHLPQLEDEGLEVNSNS